MNYREPLTKNEIRAHAAHYEQTNPAVYCGTYAKYMFLTNTFVRSRSAFI